MATRWGEDGALWLALAGSACTATAMGISGSSEGWTGIRVSIAAVSCLIVIVAAINIIRQRWRFRRSTSPAPADHDET